MNDYFLQLPFQYDISKLKKDLDKCLQHNWTDHFNKMDYSGEWTVIALRGAGGQSNNISPNTSEEFVNTPLLQQCPYFKEIIDSFQCEKETIRLMKLDSGSEIKEHTDYKMGYEDGIFRIHIPVLTNDEVWFYFNNIPIHMKEGECWYGNFSIPHRIINKGNTPRVHLVMDCERNSWSDEVFKTIGYNFIIELMYGFLRRIGISCKETTLEQDTFLPGIKIENGSLKIDRNKLKYLGDILHEAGHIALADPQKRYVLSGNVEEDKSEFESIEVGVILWSFLAARELNIPEEIILHPGGYKGDGDWILDNFRNNVFIGLPLLEYFGIVKKGEGELPAVVNWMRT